MPKVAKVKDKWKSKVWVDVLAPEILGNMVVASIPANEEQAVIGRVVPISLFQIYQDNFENNNIKLYLQIIKVEGGRAYTKVKGIEYAREVYRAMIRRGSSLVEVTGTYSTNDSYTVRLEVALFTVDKINWSKIHKIRLVADKALSDEVPNMNYDQLVASLLSGSLLQKVTEEAKKVYPIKSYLLIKMKLVTKLLTPVAQQAA